MNRTKNIAFRLTVEEYEAVEKLARISGQNPGEWCRELILEAVQKNVSLTQTEAILFEELAKVRYLIGIGFGLLSTGELDKTSWDKTKSQVDQSGDKIAAQLLARRAEKLK